MSNSKLIIFVGLFHLILFPACKTESNVSIDVNLEHISSFGDFPSDGFITRSRSIDLDRFIYVADMGTSQIHQFNLDGEFIKSFGREGRGPGEFSGNINVFSANDSIFITDFSNFTVTTFKSNGEFVKSFDLEKRHSSEFQKIQDSFIVGHSISHPFASDYFDQNLLHVYNEQGEIINSFGEFIHQGEDIPSIMQRFFTEVTEDKIHVVFFYFPIYRIYSIEGSLLSEMRLDSLVTFTDLASNSQSELKQGMNGAEMVNLKGGIGGIQIVGEKVFMPIYDEIYHRIEEFKLINNSIEHIRSYRYPLESSNRTVIGYLDFVYSEERNSFYILENVMSRGVVVSEYRLIDN